MTPDATAIENLARALCRADGYDPDMRAFRGPPLLIAGRGFAPCGQPVLAWDLYAGLAHQTLIHQSQQVGGSQDG